MNDETLKTCPRPDCKGVGLYFGPYEKMTQDVKCSECSCQMRTEEWQSFPRPEPEAREPVAWICQINKVVDGTQRWVTENKGNADAVRGNPEITVTPLYTTPPDTEARRSSNGEKDA